MERRKFLGAAAAAAASGTAALGSLVGAGARAQHRTDAAGARVVVVGGGYGGATAARYLRDWSGGAIDVTLVEANAAFVSCPLSNLVIGGSKRIEDITLTYDALVRRHGVKVGRDTAAAIDPDPRPLRRASG